MQLASPAMPYISSGPLLLCCNALVHNAFHFLQIQVMVDLRQAIGGGLLVSGHVMMGMYLVLHTCLKKLLS